MTCLYTAHEEAIYLLAEKARRLSKQVRQASTSTAGMLPAITVTAMTAATVELEALAEMALCPFYDRAALLREAIEQATELIGTEA